MEKLGEEIRLTWARGGEKHRKLLRISALSGRYILFPPLQSLPKARKERWRKLQEKNSVAATKLGTAGRRRRGWWAEGRSALGEPALPRASSLEQESRSCP